MKHLDGVEQRLCLAIKAHGTQQRGFLYHAAADPLFAANALGTLQCFIYVNQGGIKLVDFELLK